MWRQLRNDDSGAIAVIVALACVALIGISALAVDVGYWYSTKRQMQTAADSGALAACQVLGRNGTTAEVKAAGVDYAGRNFNTPVESVASTITPDDVEILGGDRVRVTVQTNARVFLAQYLLGRGRTLIRAQSVAKLGWLAGSRSPVPWGLSILQINNLSGTLGGQTRSFTDVGGGYWEGSFGNGRTGPLDILATNSQGYTETFPGLVSVGLLSSSGPIVGVDTDNTTLNSGEDTSVHVTVRLSRPLAAGQQVQADIYGSHARVTLVESSPGVFSGDVAVGTTTQPFETLTLTVAVRKGNQSVQSVTCGLMLRRASYIIQDITLSHAAITASDSVTAQVQTLNFEKNHQYQLMVEGGEARTPGNYGALDFSRGSLDHSYCAFPDTPINTSSSSSGEYVLAIQGTSQAVLHIGERLDTMTGGRSGQTNHALEDRINSITTPYRSVAEWIAAGRPETKQILAVPIVELAGPLNGSKPVRVVNFATFFLEPYDSSHSWPTWEPRYWVDGWTGTGPITVKGTFVDWTAPGWDVVDTDPGGLSIRAVHLTSQSLTF